MTKYEQNCQQPHCMVVFTLLTVLLNSLIITWYLVYIYCVCLSKGKWKSCWWIKEVLFCSSSQTQGKYGAGSQPQGTVSGLQPTDNLMILYQLKALLILLDFHWKQCYIQILVTDFLQCLELVSRVSSLKTMR